MKNEKRDSSTASPSTPGATRFGARILGVRDDGRVTMQLAGTVRDAGAEVIDGDVPCDALVALMSATSLADPVWRSAAEHAPADRLVPIRIGAIDEDKVPERLAALNWIDWNEQNPAATFGSLLAALYADPARHKLSRQLKHEAQAWVEAGRAEGLLIDDAGRAERVHDLLEELVADELAAPDQETIDYVLASRLHSRRLRRRRRRWRIGAAVVLLLVGSWALSAVPEISTRSKINRASIVAIGEPGLLEQSPAWAAFNAAELLIEGTPTQRELGRRTLFQALTRHWSFSHIDFIDSPLGAGSFDHGRFAAILALAMSRHSGVAVVDLRAGRTVATYTLPARFERIDVDSSGTVVVSRPGLATLDLRTHAVHTIAREGVVDARVISARRLASWDDDGHLVLRDASGRVIRDLGHHRTVLNLAADARGRAAALVEDADHTYSVLDVLTGATLAHARLPLGTTTGTLAPDRRHAAIAGADGQLWMFGADRSPRPSGIAVPDTAELLWQSDNRMVITSDGRGGQVVALPRGETLGRVCTGVPQLRAPQSDRDVDVITCDARSFWRLPPGPARVPWRGPSGKPDEIRGRLGDAQVSGSHVRLRYGLGSAKPRITGWSAPLNSRITAAAFSPAGDQLLLGADSGGVAILTLQDDGTRLTSAIDVPDQAPITAVEWTADGPIAHTSAHRSWHVPSCDGCGTDDGLVEAARRRLTGCFTTRQLSFTTARVQRRLGLRVCEPMRRLG